MRKIKNSVLLCVVAALVVLLTVIGMMSFEVYRDKLSIFLDATVSKILTDNTQDYDVVVVGAGSSGFGAAIQAARMGSRVALLEETDIIGGQMTASAVSTMDGPFFINDVLGVYTEFIERVKKYYSDTRAFPPSGKSVSTCYRSTTTVCFEPIVGRRILNTMLQEAGVNTFLRTRVTGVLKSGNTITGVTTSRGNFSSKVVIDATEYGDVIPLTGARYRLGNTISTNINSSGLDPAKPNACIQDITYTAPIKKYKISSLTGILSGLIMKNSPPGYETEAVRLRKLLTSNGSWNPASLPVNFWWFLSYRGMPDSSNSTNYNSLQHWLITKTGVNWSNDFPLPIYQNGKLAWQETLPISYIENPAVRTQTNCAAKLNTLQFVYYLQKEIGAPDGEVWSVDIDESYAASLTSYNVEENSCPDIPQEFKILEYAMPVMPYVRESRRIIPIMTVTAAQTMRSGNPPKSVTNFPTAVALGDYANDPWHNCYATSTLETELGEIIEHATHVGPYQIPLEALIPETVDGFIVAEKNIGGSRLFNAAVRTQPTTMVIGQAAGALAAIAAHNGIQPRLVKPLSVQKSIINAKSGVSLNQYTDVSVTHSLWPAVQLNSVYGIMTGLSATNFGISGAFPRWQMAVVIARLLDLPVDDVPITPTFTDVSKSHPQYKYIEAIYKAGITTGCSTSPKKFCPNDSITRSGFMTAMSRAFKVDDIPMAPVFKDVPANNSNFRNIQAMASLNIAMPCRPDYFCPATVMNRGDAAAFLAQALLVKIPTNSIPTSSPTPKPSGPLSVSIDPINVTQAGLENLSGKISPNTQRVRIILRQGPSGATSSTTSPDWNGIDFVSTRTELEADIDKSQLTWSYPSAVLSMKLKIGADYTVYVSAFDNLDTSKAQSTKWGVTKSSFIYLPN